MLTTTLVRVGLRDLAVTTTFALLASVLCASRAAALDVRCDLPGGDSMGGAVTTGGDMDADGVADIAIGSPCASVGDLKLVGRVDVFSGQTGTRIRAYKGQKASQKFGAAVAFYPDRDGDSRDEIVVGSFGWDAGSLLKAGKVEIIGYDRIVHVLAEGPVPGANFGETATVVSDMNGDGFEDLLVGAGEDRESGERRGRAYLVSGADGSQLDYCAGEFNYDGWGSTVAAAPEMTGDSLADLIVASNTADSRTFTVANECTTNGDCTSNGVCEDSGTLNGDVAVYRCTEWQRTTDTGKVSLVSGADMTETVLSVSGAPGEKLGAAVAVAGIDGFYAGAPGKTVKGLNKAGSVTQFSWSGEVLGEITEPAPGIAANFGAAMTVPGDVDGDGTSDIVVAAPDRGLPGTGTVGSVYAFSGLSKQVLWKLMGKTKQLGLGQTLAAAPDYDADGIPDVLISAPGDAPFGRRFAGTVRLVSGIDGSEIRRFKGRRGFETRFIVAGWAAGHAARLSSFDANGRLREVDHEPFRGLSSGDLSVAVLDESVVDAGPSDLKLVVGTGHDGGDDRVRIVGAARRNELHYEFRGFGGELATGVTVGTGDVSGDDDEDIAVVQADSADGVVRARVYYDRFDPGPFGHSTWLDYVEFTVFDDAATLPGTIRVPGAVHANGANVVVANVIATAAPDKAEIIVAPIEGALPVVRVFDAGGTVLADWQPYPVGSVPTGVNLAVGDLDGDGEKEILTSPNRGQAWIRAYNGDGSPFKLGDTAVSFYGFEAYSGGRIAVADVDVDGRGEILLAPGPGSACTVQAFEADGTMVANWPTVTPFGPACTSGLAVAGTDRVLRY